MRKQRHSESVRVAVVERVHSSAKSIEEIAGEDGVTADIIRNWSKASRVPGSFVTLAPQGATTIIEVTFSDGTVLKVRGA